MIQVWYFRELLPMLYRRTCNKYLYLGLNKGASSLKRRPSPSIKPKHEQKIKKKKKQKRMIVSESDDDCDDDTELTSLINNAEKKRKEHSNKPCSSSVQKPTEGPSSRHKNGMLESGYIVIYSF